MFALPSPIPTDPARLRALVTDPTAPSAIRRLAWAALKTDRGQPVRQTRLAALARGDDPAEPPQVLAALLMRPKDRAAHRAALRSEMLARMLARPMAAPTPDTGGDAA